MHEFQYVRAIRNSIQVVLLFAFGLSQAIGAEVSVGKDTWGDPIVNIVGKIEQGDLEKIKKASVQLIRSQGDFPLTPIRFHLNTPGGDIVESIKIGRFARELLVSIDSYGKIIIAPGSEYEKLLIKPDEPWRSGDYIVLSPDLPISEDHIVRNYSSGILIFYGAVKRAHRDNSDQRLGFYKKQDIPVMGIHRPYYEKEFFAKLSPSDASNAYKSLEKMVRTYLAEMGAPQIIIDRMFTRSSKEIDFLSDEEFRKYYKKEESFLEEWLIAKCGATGEKNILIGQELEDFMEIQTNQIRTRMNDKSSSDKSIYYLYPNEKFPANYVEALYKKVRDHNRKVNYCRENAVISYQKKWAK